MTAIATSTEDAGTDERRSRPSDGEKVSERVFEVDQAGGGSAPERTGVVFEQNWLNDVRPVYAIPDPHSMLKDVPDIDQP